MNADGSNITKITDTTVGDNIFPLWSPDGKKIMFNSNRDGNVNLYVMNADGSDVTNVTAGKITLDNLEEDKPAWSPDGTQIIFSSEQNSNWDLYVMNVDGSNLVDLSNKSQMTEKWASWKAN